MRLLSLFVTFHIVAILIRRAVRSPPPAKIELSSQISGGGVSRRAGRMSDSGRTEFQGPSRRRTPTAYEFEPLTSRQEALVPGRGRYAKALHCMRSYWLKVVLALWGIGVLLFLVAINSGVHNPPPPQLEGLSLADLLPTLQGFSTDFVTLYTTNLSAELLLMEFTESVVCGEDVTPVMFGATFARGSFDDQHSVILLHFPAENTVETLFVFRLTEDKSGVDLLREPLEVRTSDEGMRTSLSESAPPEWIATLPVLQAREGSFLTNAESLILNGFFVSDIQEPALASSRLKLSETRAYPRNAGVTIEYQLMLDPVDPGYVVPMSIRFSISALPSSPMQPRISDERVGYFVTAFKDLGDHRANRHGRGSDLLNTEVRLINKRRMDFNGDNNTEPLTYFIDPSVPPEWRSYLKTGVEKWRPAFEATGLGSDAIRAVLPDEDGWPEDYDAGDIRYNSISWAVDVDEVFALGPATVDPRTGEILHSGIVFTDGWLKAWSRVFEIYGDSADASESRHRSLLESPRKGRAGTSHAHARSHSHEHFHDHDHPSSSSKDPLERLIPSLAGRGPRHGASGSLRYHDRSGCQETRLQDISLSLLPFARPTARSRKLADGEREEDAIGSAPGLATDDILGAGLIDVVMHEVGHTLGLRHNFAASTLLTLEELQEPSTTSESGLASSVMDYLPVNLVSSNLKGAEDPHYFMQRVGEYDMWAIKYGYMAVEGEETLTQHENLQAVASLALPFSTDEDRPGSSGMNPLVSVFDLGKEPLDLWEDRLELATELWPVLLDRSTQDELQQFTRYGSAALGLLHLVRLFFKRSQCRRELQVLHALLKFLVLNKRKQDQKVLSSGEYAAKYIGGFEISKQRKIDGDTPGPIQAVDPDRQRRALTLIIRVLVGDEAGGCASFLPGRENLPNLAITDGVCEDGSQSCYSIVPVDVMSEVAALRMSLVVGAFSLPRLLRLRLQSWSAEDGSDVLMVSEVFLNVTDAIWGDGAFGSERAKLWRNWDLMLFWLEVLLAYGSAPAASLVPGDVVAEAAGLAYSVVESGRNLTASDAAYGLFRAASRKFDEWEQHGTDGYLLGLLGGIDVVPDDGDGNHESSGSLHRFHPF